MFFFSFTGKLKQFIIVKTAKIKKVKEDKFSFNKGKQNKSKIE